QRLPRGDAEPERREVEARLRLLHREHARVERRHAEVERGTPARDRLEDAFRSGAMRVEDAVRPHAHREVAGVPEAVGEEELGRGEAPVVGTDAENLPAI